MPASDASAMVLVGGTAAVDGGSPGTWVFSLQDQVWRRLKLGSAPINRARDSVVAAMAETNKLIGLLRNRHFASESEADRPVISTPIERICRR